MGDSGLSPCTVRKIHVLLSGILKAAVRWGWLPVHPLAHVKAPQATLKAMSAPEPEDVARALEAAQDVDEELHVFLRLSAALGTRRGETAALRWCDVDLEHGDVHVHRALTPLEEDPKQVIEKGTKTHANARLAIDEETVAILKAYRAQCAELALAFGVGLDADAYVFSPEPGGAQPWHPDHFGKQWERLRKKIGLTHVRLHDFRHFHGTELASAGVPMTVVRDRLRHSNLRTTSMYAHGRRALSTGPPPTPSAQRCGPSRSSFRRPIRGARPRQSTWSRTSARSVAGVPTSTLTPSAPSSSAPRSRISKGRVPGSNSTRKSMSLSGCVSPREPSRTPRLIDHGAGRRST